MNRYLCLRLFLLGSLLLAACGGETEPTESEDVDATVTAAVMTAIAENQPAANTPESPPQDTTDMVEQLTEPAPTSETAVDSPIPPIETVVSPSTTTLIQEPSAIPITESATCRTLQGLNIRRGPGTDYNPPLRALPANETLIPRAFHAIGFPGGQWVFVDVPSTGETGWVSAGSAYITCTINVAGLPAASNIIPPPTSIPPTNTPVPVVVASGPPRLSNVATGGEEPQSLDAFVFQPQLNDYFLLRIDARHSNAFDSKNGDGISHVTFLVRSEDGSVDYYSHQENTAGYCIFRGGEPDCRAWPKNGNGRYTWGEGGPEVQPGRYRIDVTVFNKDESTFNWNTRFDVTLP